MKSRATWLKLSGENTKYFQQFFNFIKNPNIVWDMKNDGREVVRNFRGFVDLGVKHTKCY
jgi:hypothetical protein